MEPVTLPDGLVRYPWWKLKDYSGYKYSDLDTLLKVCDKKRRLLALKGTDEKPFLWFVTLDKWTYKNIRYFKTIKEAIRWEIEN